MEIKYRKITIISPELGLYSKGFFTGLIFGGASFRVGLLLEVILSLKMGLACQ